MMQIPVHTCAGDNLQQLKMSTIDYLSRVFGVLLDPIKTVVDDTSLQRLLLFCTDLFSQTGVLANEEGVQCMMGYLESCCQTSSVTPPQSALTFALQLVSSVSSNPDIFNILLKKDGSTEEGLVKRLLQRARQRDMFSEPHVKEAWLQLLNRISNNSPEFWEVCMHIEALPFSLSLLKDSSMFVVKAAQQFLAKMLIIYYVKTTSPSSSKVGDPSSTKSSEGDKSVSTAEIDFENDCSNALGNEADMPSNIGKDAGDIRTEASSHPPVVSLEDSSTTEQGENTDMRVHLADEKMSEPTSKTNQVNSTLLSNGETTKCPSPDSNRETKKRPFPGSDSTVSEDESNGGGGSFQSVHKKQRLQEKPGKSDKEFKEIQRLSVGLMRTKEMATVLFLLLHDIQPSRQVQTRPMFPATTSNKHERMTLASIGVLRSLLKDLSPKCDEESDLSLKERKEMALSLLDHVAMVTRCRMLLCEDKELTDRMCDDIVEFLCCILGHQSERISLSSAPGLLCDLESLSRDLIRRGFVRPAIHLAVAVFRLCSIISQRSNEELNIAARMSLAVITSPVSIVLGEKLFSPLDAALDDHTLTALRGLMHDGKAALPFLSTSLSSLHDLLKENHDLQTLCGCDALHTAVLFLQSVTVAPMSGDQSEGLLPQYSSLIGCRRIVMSLLDLSHSAVKVNSSKSAIWALLKILNSVFKNPDAESRILMKILGMFADLLAIAIPSGDKDNATLSKELGYALQKCMCNMEWEVRDSAIACVHQLIDKKSDKVNDWLEANHLHKRLWESLVDGESYVRATSLQALPVLMGNKALWEDVLRGAHITELDVLNQIVDIICSDSEAFARRAAMNSLLTLLEEEGSWLREGVQFHVSRITSVWASSGNSKDAASSRSSSVQDVPDGQTKECGLDPDDSSGITQDAAFSRPLESSRICEQDVPGGQTKEDGLEPDGSSGSSEYQDVQRNDDDKQVGEGRSPLQPNNSKDDDELVGHNGSDPHQTIQGDGCLFPNESDIGGKVLQVIASAVQDFDWEVKIAALSLLETLVADNIPGFSCANVDEASTDNGQLAEVEKRRVDTSKNEVHDAYKAPSGEGMMTLDKTIVEVSSGPNRTQQVKGCVGPSTLKDCFSFLMGTGCLKMLLEASEDEDTSVNYKAFLMLQRLKDTLEPLMNTSESNDFVIQIPEGAPDGKDVFSGDSQQSSRVSLSNMENGQGDCPGKESGDGTRDPSFQLIGQLFSTDWTGRLRHREEDNVEGPVSLMMDIVTAAGDHDENLLDCY